IADATPQREANEKNFIPSANIEANKYYKPLPPLVMTSIADAAKKEIESSEYYKEIVDYINKAKAKKKAIDRPLSIDVAWEQRTPPVDDFEEQVKPEQAGKTAVFTVTNHSFEMQRLQANHDLKEMNEEWKEDLLDDPDIITAYKLLSLMIK